MTISISSVCKGMSISISTIVVSIGISVSRSLANNPETPGSKDSAGESRCRYSWPVVGAGYSRDRGGVGKGIEGISISVSAPLANNSGTKSLGGSGNKGGASGVTSDASVGIWSIGGIGIGGIGSIESIGISVSRPLSNDPGTVEGAGESRGRVARPVGVGIVEARVSVACIAVAGVEGVSISLRGSQGHCGQGASNLVTGGSSIW